MAEKRYFDRDGKELVVGQTVTVQHCTGRYGQTKQVTGTLIRIGLYGHVYLDTGKKGEGDCLYPGFSPNASLGPGCLLGYAKHDDFEHGHEKWIVIKS